MNEIAIVVPARLASTRFPRKLLQEVEGKTIIEWTASRIEEEAPEFPLYFAVAEKELEDFLTAKGYKVILTDPDLPSGTDRIAQANKSLKAKRIINVQADEPLVSREQILLLAELIQKDDADMATLATQFDNFNNFKDPNKVKVVCGVGGEALYFSRLAIPYARDLADSLSDEWVQTNPCLLHLGLYAYTAEFLNRFTSFEPGILENLEKLEQLRALENSQKIYVGRVNAINIGIDTVDDLDIFKKSLGNH